jgi:23S rRNA pseudouridine2605 synthase
MADDDRKRYGKPGAKPAGRPFGKRDGDHGGRPGKPFGGKKPFAKRPEEGGGERSPRSFGKGAKPQGGKPFRKPGESGFEPRPGRRERGEVKTEGATGRPAWQDRKRNEGAAGSDRPKWRDRDEQGGGGQTRFRDKPPRRFDGKPDRDGPARRPSPMAEPSGAETSERIAKRLARAGIASRRDAEALIADGRVKVNGQVLASPAFNVTAADRIELDGNEIPPVERTRLFLFHKPAGVVTTNRDPEGRRTVFDVLPKDLPRLMTVGRLDINTEGLLLLTNDGGLARVLELPATGWLRRYRVRVHGKVDAEALAGLKDGMAVNGVFYGGIEAALDREQGSNAWLTIGLREGKNREVKNILGALGLDVTRLIRISYGPFQLGELEEGTVQELKGRTLRDQLGERLIEEAGANFEAAIATPFSNKPVAGERGDVSPRPERPRIVRDGIQGRIGEGGLIKQRRRDRDRDRDDALSRLSTTRPEKPYGGKSQKPFAGKPGKPFGKSIAGGKAKPFAGKDKPFAGKDKRDERQEPPRARTSNVWMAPGARPQGKKSAAATPRSRPEGEGQDRPFKKKPFRPRDGGSDSRPSSPRSGPGRGDRGADRRR